MATFTRIPTDTFKKLQMNAGILCSEFTPADGTVDETARCDALCAHSQATVDLHTAIHGCAVQMYALNTLTNGMLASQYDWLAALSR